jgi:hypothetical protein
MERDAAGARLEAALEMADLGVEMMRERLRRSHPEDSADETTRRLNLWLRERPGASYGDAEGVARKPGPA